MISENLGYGYSSIVNLSFNEINTITMFLTVIIHPFKLKFSCDHYERSINEIFEKNIYLNKC